MLKFCNTEFMSVAINISERGSFTIPKKLREKYKLGNQVILEETQGGLMIRPAVTYPIEIYTEARLREFQEENEEALKGYKLK